MNTTNMRYKDLTFNISGSRVQLDCLYPSIIKIEGLMNDTLDLKYPEKCRMNRDVEAFKRLFGELERLQPETWGNSKGVMSRDEIKLMRIAILFGCISVLTCLVWLLVQLLK